MQTERDAQILSWIAGVGAAGAEHVMARFQIGRSRAYGRLAALVDDGSIALHRMLHGQPGLYSATRRGLSRGGLDALGVFRVGPGGFDHAWRVADASVALVGGLPDWRVLSEREIRWCERERRELFASVTVGARGAGSTGAADGVEAARNVGDAAGAGAVHRPDLALLSPHGRVVAVEVELAVKARPRLLAICRAWSRAAHVDAVYYLASNAAAGPVNRAVREARAEDRVTVLPLARAAALVEREQGRDGEHGSGGERRSDRDGRADRGPGGDDEPR